MKTLAAWLLMLFTIHGASAQPTTKTFYTAERLAQLCSSNNESELLVCGAYLVGVADWVSPRPDYQACMPENVEIFDLLAAYLEGFERLPPDAHTLNAASFAKAVYTTVWPCDE